MCKYEFTCEVRYFHVLPELNIVLYILIAAVLELRHELFQMIYELIVVYKLLDVTVVLLTQYAIRHFQALFDAIKIR